MSRAIQIPRSSLSKQALLGVIDEFIGREGTDYGHKEFSIDEKRSMVLAAFERGEVVIAFDPETETVNLVSISEMPSAGV